MNTANHNERLVYPEFGLINAFININTITTFE